MCCLLYFFSFRLRYAISFGVKEMVINLLVADGLDTVEKLDVELAFGVVHPVVHSVVHSVVESVVEQKADEESSDFSSIEVVERKSTRTSVSTSPVGREVTSTSRECPGNQMA